MNIDQILNYQPSKETYYDILGCNQSSSIEQITREYKIKALQCHPDKNPDPESLDKFKRLQTAKDILCDESSRRMYDSWLNSKLHIPFEQWQNKRGHSMHWAPKGSTKLSLAQATQSSTPDGNVVVDKKVKDDEQPWLDKFRKYEI